MQFNLAFVNRTRVFLQWLEPAWVDVEGDQHVLLGIANLGQSLRGSIATSEFIVTMNGKTSTCADEFKTDGDIYILDCLTPTFPSNATLASVQVFYLQKLLCHGLLVVNGQLAKLSSFEKYSGDQNDFSSPTVQFLAPMTYQSAASLTRSTIEYGDPVRFAFEVSRLAEVGLHPTDIGVQLKPSDIAPCHPETLSEDCRNFKESSFNFSNISIHVNQPALLRAVGLFDMYGCPSSFCGESGWGVSFDATVFIKNNWIAERKDVLRVIPKGSFSTVQVDPSTLPSLRNFPIAISIKRFWPRTARVPFEAEFQERNGAVTKSSVLKVEEVAGSELAKVFLIVPPLLAGPVAGRIFSPGRIPQRSITISTFRIFIMDDPPGPARVEWASTTSGSVAGGTEVKIRLTKFPMIDSEMKVYTDCRLSRSAYNGGPCRSTFLTHL